MIVRIYERFGLLNALKTRTFFGLVSQERMLEKLESPEKLETENGWERILRPPHTRGGLWGTGEADGPIIEDGERNIWEETAGENYRQPWGMSLASLDWIIQSMHWIKEEPPLLPDLHLPRPSWCPLWQRSSPNDRIKPSGHGADTYSRRYLCFKGFSSTCQKQLFCVVSHVFIFNFFIQKKTGRRNE